MDEPAPRSALIGMDERICLILYFGVSRTTWLIYLVMSSDLASISYREVLLSPYAILMFYNSNSLELKQGKMGVIYEKTATNLNTCMDNKCAYVYLCFSLSLSTSYFTLSVSLCRELDLLYIWWAGIAYTKTFLAALSIFPENFED